MKCPECDLEQHDNATLCSGCGLSFEMWRKHNPDLAKRPPVPPKEMAFPASEEEPTAKANPAPAEPPPERPETKASSIEPELGENPGEKKNFQWTPLLGAGLGLVIALILTGIYLAYLAFKPIPNSDVENEQPTVVSMTGSSSTPDNGSPQASTPTPEITPVEPAPTAADGSDSSTDSTAAAPAVDTPTNSSDVSSATNMGTASASLATPSPAAAAPMRPPAPFSSPDLLESSQPLPTPTAISLP